MRILRLSSHFSTRAYSTSGAHCGLLPEQTLHRLGLQLNQTQHAWLIRSSLAAWLEALLRPFQPRVRSSGVVSPSSRTHLVVACGLGFWAVLKSGFLFGDWFCA